MSEHFFGTRFRQDIPNGEAVESGYCLKDALKKAGFATDLPSWIHMDDLPSVCQELGLKFTSGKGTTRSVSRRKPIIIGHIIERSSGEGEKHIGHWEYFDKAEDVPSKLKTSDIVAIIEVPQ